SKPAPRAAGGGRFFCPPLPIPSPEKLATSKHYTAAPDSSSRGKNVLADMRILFVEDDADNRQVMTMLLSGAGARVCDVDSAAAALRSSESDRFDVILSDIGLP